MNRFQSISSSRWFAVLLTSLVTVSLLSLLRQSGLLQEAELMAFDAQLQAANQNGHAASPILLVGIDESDIHKYGYPISDGGLAKALEILLAFKPAAIGVDIFRDIPSAGHADLKALAENNPQLLFAEKKLGEPVALPDFELLPRQQGFVDLKQDLDGTIRRGLLLLWNEAGQAHFSFALQLALQFLNQQGIALSPDPGDAQGMRLGERTLRRFRGDDGGYADADDGGYQMLMDYGLQEKIPQQQTLDRVLSGKLTAEQVNAKIVIVGMVASSTHDSHETPLSAGWSTQPPLAGIGIHANVVDQLMRLATGQTTAIQTLDTWQEALLAASLSGLGALAGFWISRLRWLLLVFALIQAGLLITVFTAFAQGVWFPLIFWELNFSVAFIAAGLWMAQKERVEKRLIMQLFGKYTSPDVARMLWQHKDEFMDGHRPRPQRAVATVLITDLQGFTAPSSQMEPVQVMDWINRYMEAMTEVAIKYGGFVDDYAGDGLKVDFGIPITHHLDKEIARDACQAVSCALEMGRLVTRLRTDNPNDPPLRLRAGINTGELVVGSVGSATRMKYTTMGDTVNTAARLESFQKEQFKHEPDADFRLLVSGSTRARLGETFHLRPVGQHILKGHDKATSIYQVLRSKDLQFQLREVV